MACRNEEKAIEAQAKLLDAYPEAKGKLAICDDMNIKFDIADFEKCTEFVEWVEKQYGEVDCLINNATIALSDAKENNEENAKKTL